jgi:hypothetical protein
MREELELAIQNDELSQYEDPTLFIRRIESMDTDYLNTLLSMIDSADKQKLWKIEQ